MIGNRIGCRGVSAAELLLIVGLIGLDVVARLLPHAPNFTPVAASALFAGVVLGRPLAVVVPLAAMALSDGVLGFQDWRMMLVVYAALALPAVIGLSARRTRLPIVFPLAAASSVIFFVATNFAVWVFSGIYTLDAAGLAKCYVAALPFFQNTLAGDLFWTTMLFGGLWIFRFMFGPRKAEVLAG